jgi:hypothetical protein
MQVRGMLVLAVFFGAITGCTSLLGDFATASLDATAPDGSADGPTDAASDTLGMGDNTMPQDSGLDGTGSDADAGCGTGLTGCATGCVNLQDASTNCGACGHDCNGGSCAASVCGVYPIAAAPKSGTVAKLATDGKRVIWSDTGKAAILQIPAVGGNVLTLAPSGTPGTVGPDLAFANGTAAFTYNGSTPSVGLAKVDVANSGAPVYQGGVAVNAVSMNPAGTHLFYVDTTGTQSDLNDCPLNPDAGACRGVGDTGRFLAQTAADNNYLLFDLTAGNIAQPGLYLDVISSNTSGIFDPDRAQSLAVDGTWAYWTEMNDAGSTYVIHRVLESSPNTSLQTPVSSIASSAFATDGTNLYYWTGSAVASFPAAGGVEKTLAPATKFVEIAVGGGLLVWTDGNAISGLVLP